VSNVERWLVSVVLCLMALPARAETKAERSTADVLVADARDRMRAGDVPGAVKRLATAYGLVADPEIGLELGRALDKSNDALRAVAVLREVAATRGGDKKKRAAVQSAATEAAAVAKRLGWLKVEVSTPPGRFAELSLDERIVPAGAFVAVNPGKHRIFLRGEGLAPVEREIELLPSKRETVRIELTPPAPPVTTGKLNVTVSGGRSASLLIDGKRVGALPYSGELSPGEYRIRAEAKGARSAEQSVKITLGEEQRITLTLAENTGRLEIRTPYAAASLYLDGELVGQGHYQSDVADGEHEVTITLEGHYPLTRRVQVVAGKPALLAVDSLVAVGAATEVKQPYRGSYIRLSPTLLAATGPASDTLTSDCVPDADCSARNPLGVGFRLGVGWSFGVIAAEYFMLGLVDRWKVDVEHPSNRPFPRTEEYAFYRYGGAAGAALRATSRGETFRVSGGLGGALAIRAVQFERTTDHASSNVTSEDVTGKSALLLAPGLTADLGVLIGSTPGAKLYVGLLAYAELTPFSTPSGKAIQEDFGGETAAIDYVTKSQFFLGPSVGVQLGR
jgi:hypothetical protein